MPREPEKHGPPRTLDWAGAPEAIAREAAMLVAPGRGVVIGVSGPVGSGKSTLAGALSACIVPTDMYLPDYAHVPYLERDDPAHADFSRLAADVDRLRRGLPASIPIWSFQTHRREGERAVYPAGLIIIEGIHALNARVAPLTDLRVLVEAPAALRWQRWEFLERTGVRGWGVEAARQFFTGVAEPTFDRFAGDYRARAHFIVRNDRGVPG